MTRLLLTGASGQLGAYLLRELAGGGEHVTAWSGTRTGTLFGHPLRLVDLADPGAVAAAFRQARPDAVVHAGAVSSVAECYRDPHRARRVNVAGTAALAELSAEAGARLLYVYTDMVFDGRKGWYVERDQPAPLSTYGRSKADAEPAVRALAGGVVARVSLLFGPTRTGRPSFFDQQLAALRERRPITLFEDEWRTPLDYVTAARALLALVRSDFRGVVHLGGPERMSRLEMGRRLAASLNADPSVLVASRRDEVHADEPRPRDNSLDSSLWSRLFPEQPWPAWEAALREMEVA
jgi:dTDP-4-dehydrorhamnose reductase